MLFSHLMNFDRKYILPASIAAIVLLVVGIGGYLYYQSQKSQAAPDEAKRLVVEVGKLIDLPNEDPTVATITDIGKLKDQPFFQKGKNGDKVLIYAQARKAILYDPQEKKVLDVAPINLGTSSGQIASPTATPR